METQFRGRFEARLDQKSRLTFPSSLRSEIPPKDSRVVLTNSQYKGHRCLDLYTHADWVKLENRISKMNPLRSEVQDFRRLYLSGGQSLEIDNQGRILVPQILRKHAEIESDVLLVGMGNKIEIWSSQNWNHLYQNLAKNFDSTLAAVALLDEEKK